MLKRTRKRPFRAASWIPFLVAGLMLAVTFWFFKYSQKLNDQETQLVTSRKMDVLTEQVSQVLNDRLLSLDRMARRVEYMLNLDKAAWQADAQVLRQHVNGLHSLQVLKENGESKWVSGELLNRFQKENQEIWSQMLQATMSSTKTQLFNISLNSEDHENVFVVMHPLYRSGKRYGFMLAVGSTEAFLGHFIDISGFEMEIRSNAKIIYNSIQQSKKYLSRWKLERRVQAAVGDFWIKLVPQPATIAENRSLLPKAIVIVGVLFSGLIGAIIHLSMGLRNRSREIEEQKKFLDTVIENLPVAVYCKDYDDDLKFSIWNKKSEEIFKIKKATAIGKNDYDLFSKDMAEVYRNRDIESFITGESSVQSYEEIVKTSGEQLILKFTKVPILNENQELVYMIGIAENITEAKKAEIALRDSENKFSSFMENTPSMTWIKNSHGRYQFRNSRFNQIFKVENSGVVSSYGQSATITEQSRLQGLRQDREVLEEHKSNSAVHILVDGAGKAHHWMVFKFPMKMSSGETYIGAVAFDITDRIEVEQNLQNTTKTLRALIDASPVPILTLDLEGHVEVWSPACEKVFGWTAEEVVGRSLPFVAKGQKAESRSIVQKIIALGEKGFQTEVSRFKKDGSPIDLHLDARVLLDEEKKAVGLIAIMADISDRLLAEKKLKEAKNQAETAARLKSEFLANVSHEIRTPLNGVIGMTDLLLDSDLNPEQRKYAQIVQNSGSILLNLINDILDLSKIEAGKLTLENTQFSLSNLVESHVELLMAKAREKRLSLMTFVDPNIPQQLGGDPARLAQILVNLMGNAIKFTHSGGVSVKVGFDQRYQQRNDSIKLRFEVQDTGIGLSAESREKLFMPFTQAESSTTRKYGGTGLGLSISKRLVEAMQGEIGVTSQVGQGSIFWFTAELKVESSLPILSWPKRKQVQDLKVLLIDDDPIAQDVVPSSLRAWGLSLFPTPEYERAADMVWEALQQQKPFDVILIGQGQDKRGQKLAAEIYDRCGERAGKMVLLLPFEESWTAAELKEQHFYTYLSKPFKQSTFFDVLVKSASSSLIALEPSAPQKFQDKIETQTQDKSNLRILVADDVSTNQILAIKLLQSLGYSAQAVANGKEALDALALSHYDLILMDCQMPEMDGFEASREIRKSADPRIKKSIIIALTANAMSGDKERCLEAGMNDYLTKPLKKDKLLEMLNRWLKVTQKTA